nr:LOW QUALITY PROTEIN: uncharacterized protein encoded by LINC00116-like [Equus caballus]
MRERRGRRGLCPRAGGRQGLRALRAALHVTAARTARCGPEGGGLAAGAAGSQARALSRAGLGAALRSQGPTLVAIPRTACGGHIEKHGNLIAAIAVAQTPRAWKGGDIQAWASLRDQARPTHLSSFERTRRGTRRARPTPSASCVNALRRLTPPPRRRPRCTPAGVMADVSERTLQLSVLLAFASGVLVGWQANRLRRRYLDWRKRRLQDKLAVTQKKLDLT